MGVVGGRVVGERLGDDHARVVDQGVEAAEPFQRRVDDPVDARRVGNIAFGGARDDGDLARHDEASAPETEPGASGAGRPADDEVMRIPFHER